MKDCASSRIAAHKLNTVLFKKRNAAFAPGILISAYYYGIAVLPEIQPNVVGAADISEMFLKGKIVLRSCVLRLNNMSNHFYRLKYNYYETGGVAPSRIVFLKKIINV